MGFYFRKSVRVGPLRFNLSKSGIGTSVGIKGFRIGAGPRGNYVHMGRGGLYYRASLSSPASTPSNRPLRPTPAAEVSVDTLTEIESGSVVGMTDSSSEALIRELNEKRKKWRLWPWVLAASLIGAPQLSRLGVPESLSASLMLLGLCVTPLVWYWDRLRRTTVLLYDLEADAERRYQQLHDGFDQLAACGGTWHLEAQGAIRDSKRHAGADALVRRKRVRLSKHLPSTIRTNVEVPTIPAGRQVLCLFPDRLIVLDRDGVGAVRYSDLIVDVTPSRFIESEAVPSDATVVDHTWRYVNKKGGPDKRFKANRQLPICAYEEIAFRSRSGLNEVIHVSKRGTGERLRDAIQAQFASMKAAPPSAS